MQKMNASLCAVIDLGSSSFHLLVVKVIDGKIAPHAKMKQKVRLASGMSNGNLLSDEAMQRGWDCLTFFRPKLKNIMSDRIRVVGTAALREAKNANVFLDKAVEILGHPIHIISGEEEAYWVYQGAACMSPRLGKRLVIDIGGASTELSVGEGRYPTHLKSIKLGCVVWFERFFSDHQLTEANFSSAIQCARMSYRVMTEEFQPNDWDFVVGASGIMQAIQRILDAQQSDEKITLSTLIRLKEQAIACQTMENLHIEGLIPERAPLFISGLTLLIALFQLFFIDEISLAQGAIREGLLFDILDPIFPDEDPTSPDKTRPRLHLVE